MSGGHDHGGGGHGGCGNCGPCHGCNDCKPRRRRGATGPTGPCCTGPTGPGSTVTGPTGLSITGPTGPCCTGPTGPASTVTGPTGPSVTGPTGPASTVTGPTGPADFTPAFAGASNTSLAPLLLVPGSPVPWSTPGPSQGIVIGADDLTVAAAGTYHLTFVGQTAAVTALGGFQAFVNGAPVGPDPGLISGGAALVLDELLVLGAGDVVEIRSTGLGVTLATGPNATITLERIA